MSRSLAVMLGLLSHLSAAGAVSAAPTPAELLSWVRLRADEVGCRMEKQLGHRDKRFNCALKAYANNSTACSLSARYEEGPKFPKELASRVHPRAVDVDFEFEHGDLRVVRIRVTGILGNEEARQLMDLVGHPHPDSISVQPQRDTTTIGIFGFDHMGGADVECGDERVAAAVVSRSMACVLGGKQEPPIRPDIARLIRPGRKVPAAAVSGTIGSVVLGKRLSKRTDGTVLLGVEPSIAPEADSYVVTLHGKSMRPIRTLDVPVDSDRAVAWARHWLAENQPDIRSPAHRAVRFQQPGVGRVTVVEFKPSDEAKAGEAAVLAVIESKGKRRVERTAVGGETTRAVRLIGLADVDASGRLSAVVEYSDRRMRERRYHTVPIGKGSDPNSSGGCILPAE